MDRIWQWTWDRCEPRYYWWALCVAACLVSLPVYSVFILVPIVASEKSGRYVDATVVTVITVLLLVCIMVLPGRQWIRFMQQWAAGREIDRAAALEETYRYSRKSSALTVWATGVWAAALSVVVAAIAGAAWTRWCNTGSAAPSSE